ncbi:DNA polymerase III subunit tau [Candidatus Mikella endobia]|uniref:DNA polymerase III subunit gamma/tau n=1 Tax=Candidatus Mikella endobia TaxID=1778264 RepID=A0A143WQR6_9ENTR|nr:DNA polymerase III subunit gamma/tau [Candidatus Mikella endobia]CUX96033.1 DNA polymerase III subunit tau [Candidatus Mikella endobia]
MNNYQVLARKWRPQIFADVVGQKHILIALANSLLLGRIHHAYLLSGMRGVGKTTIARLLAKGLNCKIGITDMPCGQCQNCREIAQSCFVDLIEIDAASRTKVEDTRELIDNIQYVPTVGRFKVYLIDEVHMLSRYSFNALLKTLEEPPDHVKFLLATTDPQKLPATIISRCLQFHLKAIDIEQIRSYLSIILQKENIVFEQQALNLLARAAAGSMRDALSLTDQAISIGKGKISTHTVHLMLGTLNTDQSLNILESLANADGNTMLKQLALYANNGINWENLLVNMLDLLHRIAIGQLLPDQLKYEENQDITLRLQKLAHRLSPDDLQLYYQTLLIGRKELPFAPTPRIGVEITLLRALAFYPNTVPPTVIPASAEKKTSKFSAVVENNLSLERNNVTTYGFNPYKKPLKKTNTNINFYSNQNNIPKRINKSVDYDKLLTNKSLLSDTMRCSARVSQQLKKLAIIQIYFAPKEYQYFYRLSTGEKQIKENFIQIYASATNSILVANNFLPNDTTRILNARKALLRYQKFQQNKKDQLIISQQNKFANSALERLAKINRYKTDKNKKYK